MRPYKGPVVAFIRPFCGLHKALKRPNKDLIKAFFVALVRPYTGQTRPYKPPRVGQPDGWLVRWNKTYDGISWEPLRDILEASCGLHVSSWGVLTSWSAVYPLAASWSDVGLFEVPNVFPTRTHNVRYFSC